ncbi:MAG: fibrobacter succinogenes major paralogous domain-containing protein [Burkholderiales bacterium]|nr:fibrobacter succinogenes major paralogous domain-containing protein [Flavobacterium sp.]
MRKYYFSIISILFLIIGFASCSDEKTKTQNEKVSRPSVPILASERQIGNNIWMIRNLNVNYYRNGDPILQVTNPTQWANLTTGAWCYYNSDPANGAIYGKIYNWYAVHDPRGLAPQGYHIPSDLEWVFLTNSLGDIAIAGGKMKEVGIAHWKSPNTGATNNSGFTGVPGGGRGLDGTFSNLKYYGVWWTSSESDSFSARIRHLYYESIYCVEGSYPKHFGLSVRCVKD